MTTGQNSVIQRRRRNHPPKNNTLGEKYPEEVERLREKIMYEMQEKIL